MVCQPLRLALLIGAITAVAVSPVRANHRAPACCGNPCGASGTTAPAYRTITCTEWVNETYQTKRTCYRTECRTETYDTCRTECVPECRERTVCVTKRIPIVKEEIRKVCHKVTVYEDRVVNKTCYKYVQETCMQKQLVCRGHWETCQVPAHFNGFGGGHGHKCHKNSCDNCCNDSCATSCPRMRTKKHWVNCPEYRECPVTVCKKVCYTQCVTCKVPVCRTEWRDVCVKVCTYQCVTENRVEKYTCYVSRQVPCKATRTVRVCVPYEETVNCCRSVPRTVTRQVADYSCCNTSCCTTSCCNTCETSCCTSKPKHRFGGRGHGHTRSNSDCCRTSCCN